MSYSLRAGSGRNSSFLILLASYQQTRMTNTIAVCNASCQQTCMTYTIAVCKVRNSWWWTEELSETYRALFQKINLRN